MAYFGMESIVLGMETIQYRLACLSFLSSALVAYFSLERKRIDERQNIPIHFFL